MPLELGGGQVCPIFSCFNHTMQLKWGGGAVSHIESILAFHPAAPGSNPGSAKIFSPYCLVCGQY